MALSDIKITDELKIENLIQAAKEIDTYTQLISTIDFVFRSIKVLPNSSCMTNYRDALFHYRVMFTTDNVETFIAQNSAIVEHLQRGIKDAIVYFIGKWNRKVWSAFEKHRYECISTEDSLEIIRVIHELKNISLELRMNNMEIKRNSGDEFDSILIVICENVSKIKEILDSYRISFI